ncbi:hypothetical protein E8Q34_16280 [Halomonas sp. 15WGF]|nr:hypothetical protein E8Q34_16280 [Halomonas sp. 15WGF]
MDIFTVMPTANGRAELLGQRIIINDSGRCLYLGTNLRCRVGLFVKLDPALFTRAPIERSEGTGCWHCLSGSASSARMAVE